MPRSLPIPPSRIVRPIARFAVDHVRRLVTDGEARRYERLVAELRRVPRYTLTEVEVHGFQLRIPDVSSFLSAYREIFVVGAYAFSSLGGSPRILDLGANIGLASIFWKLQHPGARIVAVEPDRAIFGDLVHNLRAAQASDVRTVNAAVWGSAGKVRFLSDGADAGRVVAEGSSGGFVDALDIRELLDEPVDLLKLDIEGAEGLVLQAAAEKLDRVARVIVEVHSTPGLAPELHDILGLLARAGFRYHVVSMGNARQPLVSRPVYAGFDNQLNVFAFRG